MYDDIYNNGFIINFLISFVFLFLTLLFSFSLSLNIRNKNIKIFEGFRPIIIFFLVFVIYSFILNILILFDKYQYINEVFYVIFFAQLIFFFKNFKFLKNFNQIINKKYSNKEIFILILCPFFFLISILPMTDADSIAMHQNLASRIYLNGLSEINLLKNIEFTLLSNTEILLIFSALLNSDNFGAQLNLITLVLFILYNLKKNKNFIFILLSCPLIIFFISTQKLQLFFGLLYLLLFVLIHKNLIKTKLEFFVLILLLVFYSSGKLSYALITMPLYFYFFYKNAVKFKLILIYSFISFSLIYFPLLANKQIYFGNMVAPFFDNIFGSGRELYNAFTLSVRSSEGWLLNSSDIKLYLRPFLPNSIYQLSGSLGIIFFLMLIDFNLLKKTKFIPVIIILLIFATGQFLPRYYFESFLLLAYFFNLNNIFAKFIVFAQSLAVLVFSTIFMYLSYIDANVIFDKLSFKERFSYSYLNYKSYNDLSISENILDINQDRQSIYFDNNISSFRTINVLNSFSKKSENNIIDYIDKNSIKYLIAKSKGNLPNCLILKKIDEIYAKRSIRNFLIKNKLYKKDVFKLVKNNCKI